MKKYSLISITLMFVSFLSSCYKDTSTLADRPIEPVVLDTAGLSGNIYIGYQEKLTLSPKIKEKTGQSLSFQWSISEKVKTERKVDMKTIGDRLELNYEVERPVATAAYLLRLTITDLAHDSLQYFYTWDVFVQSTYVTGLVIADTKDGSSSRLTYIKNKDFSTNYKKDEVILRDILSADSVRIKGLVASLHYSALGRFWRPHTSQLWVTTTDGKVVRYNTSDFSVNGRSERTDLILYKPEGFRFNFFFKGGDYLLANTTHGNYSLPSTTTNVFSTADPVLGNAKFSNNVVAGDPHSGITLNNLVWLEESTGAFTAHTYTHAFSYELATFNKTDAFDPNRLDDKIALAGEISYDHKMVNFLLKDKETGEYAIYQLDQGESNPSYVKGSAKGLFKIPASFKDKMDKAISYFLSKKENILYVATESEIYTITFGLGNEAKVNTTPVYTLPEGEQLRKAKLFVQGQYAARANEIEDKFVPVLPYNLNAITLISEKGENKGIVRVLPFSNNGIKIDADKGHTYEGFGKVLDVISIGM